MTPTEPIVGTLPQADLDRLAVTMTRKRWSAMLDHLNAELEPKIAAGTATSEEIAIVIHLACALISAGGSAMERALVEETCCGA